VVRFNDSRLSDSRLYIADISSSSFQFSAFPRPPRLTTHAVTIQRKSRSAPSQIFLPRKITKMRKESRSQFHHEGQAHRYGDASVVSASVAGGALTAMRPAAAFSNYRAARELMATKVHENAQKGVPRNTQRFEIERPCTNWFVAGPFVLEPAWSGRVRNARPCVPLPSCPSCPSWFKCRCFNRERSQGCTKRVAENTR